MSFPLDQMLLASDMIVSMWTSEKGSGSAPSCRGAGGCGSGRESRNSRKLAAVALRSKFLSSLCPSRASRAFMRTPASILGGLHLKSEDQRSGRVTITLRCATSMTRFMKSSKVSTPSANSDSPRILAFALRILPKAVQLAFSTAALVFRNFSRLFGSTNLRAVQKVDLSSSEEKRNSGNLSGALRNRDSTLLEARQCWTSRASPRFRCITTRTPSAWSRAWDRCLH
mmetsp:Transcript_13390/g.37023  ORF Transcript_13390/g.37023 Transcript_13390/m.37023 type:complete len:227 (+) Transcript_13390:1571-2251(+)